MLVQLSEALMSDNDDAKASVRNALAAELRAAKLRVKRASHRLVFVSSPAGKRLEVLSF